MNSMKFCAVALGVMLLGSAVVHSAVSEPGFSEANFATAGFGITGLAWAPDGSNRLFVTHQMGEVRIVKDGALLPMPFATMNPIYTQSECGLIGICFDPNYVVNRYVYVFVTVSSSEQKILRFVDNNDVGTNEVAIVSGLPTAGQNHDGGAVGVGHDGNLYWAIGDLGNATGVDADLTSLASKVGRASLSGAALADNPFNDGAGPNNNYIWARGFRNPFTLTFHPVTGDIWVNVTGDNYEQIFRVRRGDHAGWNDYQNNQPTNYIVPKIKYKTNGTDNRSIGAGGAARVNNVATFVTTSTNGFRQGEKLTIAGVGDSSFNGVFYVASVLNATTFTIAQTGANATSGGGTATTESLGGALTGGYFYDSTAVPAAYRGNFFFCDFNSDRVMRAVVNQNSDVLSVDYFASGIIQAVDVTTGPDGALYYAEFGGAIYRTSYASPAPGLFVQPAHLHLPEGGEAVFTVRLATAPAGNVTVTVARSAGDSDINVTNATLVFTPGNYATPQSVRVVSASDGDSTDDSATISVSASALPTEAVMVSAYEMPGGVTSFTSMNIASNGVAQMRLSTDAGSTYVLDATTNLWSWLPLATNLATTNSVLFTDPAATNFKHRFYRARKL